MPVFVLGNSYREFAFYLENDQTVSLYLHNQNSIYTSSHSYSLNTWYKATIAYSSYIARLYLDDILVLEEVFSSSFPDYDKKISNTNFSNCAVYKGLWENLIVKNISTIYISANAEPSYGGTISGTGNYDYGQTAELTATAATGYDFMNWTENGTEVSTDTNYSFTVTESRTLVANFENIVNITAVKNDMYLTIYPNPATGKVTIKGENIEMIKIINIYGQVVKQIKVKTDETNIDLSNQAKGIYFVKVVTNYEIITEKIILE